MFIRFCSGVINQDSLVPAGLFCAALDLLDSGELPEYECLAISELEGWFDKHLRSPFDYLPFDRRYDRAVCWFKPTAYAHLARAWELVAVLERNDVLIWTIKSPRIGYVHYEDEVQVFARPYGDIRLLLKRV